MSLIPQMIQAESEDAALSQVYEFLHSKRNLAEWISKSLRQAFDEVIDGPRTGRFRIEQLEKTEKTYIGTKVEIILRDKLALPRGTILDNLICGHEVDTKFSLSGGWMIPREAIDQLCLLVKGNDNSGVFSVGLLRTSLKMLTNGSNQDGKKNVSAYGKEHITWLLLNIKMPRNFLLDLDPNVREHIMSQKSGIQRIKALFMNVTGQIIPRIAIEQVAQQKDSLRRARQMKAILSSQGFQILCSTYKADREKFMQCGFIDIKGDDWLSIKSD